MYNQRLGILSRPAARGGALVPVFARLAVVAIISVIGLARIGGKADARQDEENQGHDRYASGGINQ